MRTELCKQLGIEYPILAFTYSRNVVAAVSNSGGFGLLGAVGFTAEQLETELQWIDAHVGDRPYDVDIVLPNKYEGKGEELRELIGWTNEWEHGDTPDPLGMPMQFMVTVEAVARHSRYPAQAQKVGFDPAGQVIGRASNIQSVRAFTENMIEEYLDTAERMNSVMPE